MPVLFVLLSMISLTTGASMAKQLFQVAGAPGTVVVRLGIGALLMCAFWRPWRSRLSREAVKWIVLYGICLGSMNLCFYLAISRLPIGLAIAIEFLGPLSLALYHSRHALDFLWALLAASGVFLILPLAGVGGADVRGVLYALGAALMWALYIVLSKKVGKLTSAGTAATLGTAVGFLAIAPFCARAAAPLLGNSALLVTALGVGFLSSALPYSLEMVALKSIPEKTFSLLMSVEPAIGAIAGFVLLGEHLTVRQLGAIGCVILASVGSTVSHREAELPPIV